MRDAAASGRRPRIPTPEQTQAGVDERANATLDEVLAEWAVLAEELAGLLSADELRSQAVHDITQHEADLRGTFGAQRVPDDVWLPILESLAPAAGRWMRQPARLVIVAGERRWTVDGDGDHGGGAEPVTVRVEPYDLWRGFFGRRSVRQMAAWDWSADPAPYLANFAFFGPAENDIRD